jgi:hypothetical protein
MMTAAVLEPWSAALQDASKVHAHDPSVNVNGGGGAGAPPIPFVGGVTLTTPTTLPLPPPKPKWYRHTILIQVLVVIAVFFACWIVFAAIRPPFTMNTNKKHGDQRCPDSFSPAKGAAAAGLCVLVLVACMIAFAFIFKTKKPITPKP